MSKRGMEFQGGADRYGGMDDGQNNSMDDKPKQATAAQLARRKILQAKGKGSARGSRSASPATGVPPQSNPFQSFQPPESNSFNFNMPGAAPAPSFGGQPPAQNGTNGFSGFGASQNAAPRNPFSFGQNNSQAQQTGFNQTPSFSFGQNGSQAPTPGSSFTFGQPQNTAQEQPNTNGFTSTTSFGGFSSQPSQPQQNGTTPFNFGQSQPQPPNTPSFGGFGQQDGDKPAGTGLFGSTPAPATAETSKPATSVFSGLNSVTNGVKPGMFTPSHSELAKQSNPFAGFGQKEPEKPAETPKAPTFSFGQSTQEKPAETPKAPAFSFGQSAQERPPETPNAPPFSFGQITREKEAEKSKPASTFAFGQADQAKEAETSKHKTPFSFGQTAAPTNGDATPKANLFSGGFQFGQRIETDKAQEQPNSPEKPASTPFKFGQTQETPRQASNPMQFGQAQETPKPAPTPFQFGTTQDTPKPSNDLFSAPTPGFEFGASQQEDTSMLSANNTPQKTNPGPSTEPAHTSGLGTPANPNAGRSLFDRISKLPGTAPSKSVSFSDELSRDQSGGTAKNLFVPNASAVPATAPRPSTNLFSNPSDVPRPAPPLFSAPAPVHPPAAPKPANAQLPGKTMAPAPTSSAALLAPTGNKTELQELNEGLLEHLNSADATRDWSAAFQYYLEEAAKLTGSTEPKSTPQQAAPTALASGDSFSTPAPKANVLPPPSAKSTQAQAPQAQTSFAAPTTPAANLFSQPSKPPATAPVNKKRSADEELTKNDVPATEKRARPNERIQYPKLPENSSKTSQLFASALDSAEKPMSTNFGPPADVYAKAQEQKAAKEAGQKSIGFTPSTTLKFGSTTTVKPAEAQKDDAQDRPSFAFQPPTPSSAAAPATGSLKPPSFSKPSGSASFLSSFGQAASQEQEKEKKKRMEDDYDSEDDDMDEWEAKYKAEQDEKRRQIEEAAKNGPVFSFTPSTGAPVSSTPFAFKLPGQDSQEQAGTQSTTSIPTAGSNLFTPAEPPTFTPSTFSFSAAKDKDGKTAGEKAQGDGNKTHDPKTPIKFSAPTARESTTPAAAPPANPFAGLFGSGATATTKLAPPSVGFGFGGPGKSLSSDVSRATTPGVMTDGESSNTGGDAEGGDNSGPSEEQNDKQIEDMTGLLPAEREENDVLLELPIAVGKKMEDKQTDSGTAKTWVEKGRGPLYILKDKSTSKTRILLKVAPMGRVAMNFGPIKAFQYKNEPGKKTVSATFIDHLDGKNTGKPSQWSILVKEPEKAAEIARILEEEKQ